MARRCSRATVSFSCSQSKSSDNSAGLGQRGILGCWMGDTLAICIVLGAGETGNTGVIVDAQGLLLCLRVTARAEVAESMPSDCWEPLPQ